MSDIETTAPHHPRPALSAHFAEQISTVALDMVAEARARQIRDKGFSYEHDDQLGHEELGMLAAAYLVPAPAAEQSVCYLEVPEKMALRPLVALLEEGAGTKVKRQQQGTCYEDTFATLDGRIEDLVTGTAVALAELERLLRIREHQDRDD